MHLKICLDWHSFLLFPSGNAPRLWIYPDPGLLSGCTTLTPGWQMLERLGKRVSNSRTKAGKHLQRFDQSITVELWWGAWSIHRGLCLPGEVLNPFQNEGGEQENTEQDQMEWNNGAGREWLNFTRKMCYSNRCHSDPVSMRISTEEESNI